MLPEPPTDDLPVVKRNDPVSPSGPESDVAMAKVVYMFYEIMGIHIICVSIHV